MFKVGDKVRCIKQGLQPGLKDGDTYTVKETHQATCREQMVSIEGNSFKHFSDRFELVTDEPFNVSTATDQELADEYRRVWGLALEAKEALKARGYTVTYVGRDIVARKIETKTINL